MASGLLDAKSLLNIQTSGYSAGGIDVLRFNIGGVYVPGIMKKFNLAVIERETVQPEGNTAADIPTRNFKPVNFNFEILINHPAIMGILVRSPSFQCSSGKTRMALMLENQRYEDAVDIVGVFKHFEQSEQAFKGLDTLQAFFSVHSYMHRWADGQEEYEVAYYRQNPGEVRIYGLQLLGGQADVPLIT